MASPSATPIWTRRKRGVSDTIVHVLLWHFKIYSITDFTCKVMIYIILSKYQWLYYIDFIILTCTEANREARQAHYPIPNNFQWSILDLCVRICSCPHACVFHIISNARSLNFTECVKNCKAKSWNTKSGRRVKCLCYAVFFLISSNRSSIWIWFYLLILILYYFIY